MAPPTSALHRGGASAQGMPGADLARLTVAKVKLVEIGIGAMSAFLATVASSFVTQEEGPDLAGMEARLARVAQKLDLLLAQHGPRRHP